MLNRNIGCIEISESFPAAFEAPPLNRNIGCIEIAYTHSTLISLLFVEP